MGHSEKLRKLCALRNLDHSALAERVGISRSSMSRILNGTQEPKLGLAAELARALGVTLDYLAGEDPDANVAGHLVVLTTDELAVLRLVRRLGTDSAIDRLLGVGSPTEPKGSPARENAC